VEYRKLPIFVFSTAADLAHALPLDVTYVMQSKRIVKGPEKTKQ